LNLNGMSQSSDAALRKVMSDDAAGDGETISAVVHLSRAEIYSANRLFPQARKHWQIVFENFPSDPAIPKALFGTARSFMWERNYAEAARWFNRLATEFPETKDGREGLAYKGASLVRLGDDMAAAKVYEQYVAMFPAGERIESAHLNIIDAYREAGKFKEAEAWTERTIRRFQGKPTEVNALHSLLRMEIYRENWGEAIAAADRLLSGKSFASSMAGSDEVKYLRAFALERTGKRSEALSAYSGIPVSLPSYYSYLATQKAGGTWVKRTGGTATKYYADYPVMYRAELLKYATPKKIDPRFVLAIMKQESSFRAAAKSPAGARGLLQLVYDTAIKYNKKAGFAQMQPDDLYSPAVNIAVGSEYIRELKAEFGDMYEAIAASYNGGEDNVARWMHRSRPKEPGIFVSEIGFAESKNYVYKVMSNYRMYQELYTENLERR
ncbi:MAG: transglycosylase SLT domain-containing protein, partial [Acidobacteriota bacterium]